MPRANEYQIEIECPYCKSKFLMNKYNLKRRGHEYCRDCALSMPYVEMIGTKVNNLTILRFGTPRDRSDGSKSSTFICRCDCGNEIEVFANSVKRNHTKSCGCHKTNVRSEAWSGSNNPQFANLTEEEKSEPMRVRQSFEYQRWREAVINRDFGECQKCGTDLYIEVHHVLSFKHNPELALDIDNGVTLCSTCHRDYHKFNGGTRKETSIESFREWYAL